MCDIVENDVFKTFLPSPTHMRMGGGNDARKGHDLVTKFKAARWAMAPKPRRLIPSSAPPRTAQKRTKQYAGLRPLSRAASRAGVVR